LALTKVHCLKIVLCKYGSAHIYGLREAVKNSEGDIREFVNKHFYVDDALTSLPTADMAVSLLKRTHVEEAKSHRQCPNPSDPFQGLPLRTET
jgi:hypothetical protein